MKNFLVTFTAIFLMQYCYCQKQDSLNVNESEKYCAIYISPVPMGAGFNITVDYGDGKKKGLDTREKDQAGNPLKFSSHIEAFNYMASKGWILSGEYTFVIANDKFLYYVFKKSVLQSKQ